MARWGRSERLMAAVAVTLAVRGCVGYYQDFRNISEHLGPPEPTPITSDSTMRGIAEPPITTTMTPNRTTGLGFCQEGQKCQLKPGDYILRLIPDSIEEAQLNGTGGYLVIIRLPGGGEFEYCLDALFEPNKYDNIPPGTEIQWRTDLGCQR